MSKALLISGDCLRAMRTLPTHSVDLIIADLPYGVTKNKWDVTIPLDALWEMYERVAKATAAIVLTATQPFATDLISSNRAMFKYDWIWPKPPVSPLNAKKRPMPAHEHVLVFYTKQPTYNPQGVKEMRRFRTDRDTSKSTNYGKTASKAHIQRATNYPTSVLRGIKNMAQPDKVHPTQKPVELMEYLVRTYSNPGDVVLDNVMGSGTTGLAAIRLGRDFIGIEKDENYFAIAEKRIREHATSSGWLEGKNKCTVTTSALNTGPKSKRKLKRASERTPVTRAELKRQPTSSPT
jgi:site-specific DNA-methyltransferase (adenine-specific)